MKHTILRALCLLCAVMLLGTVALTGCGEEKPATEETPATNETPAPAAHDHDTLAAMRLAYETAADGTYTLIVKNCEGAVLCNQTGLAEKAVSHQISEAVVELSWVLSNKPGGYQCLYINRQTCQVSDMIAGEQATDGNRLVYSEVKDGVLTVFVRDLFNKAGYHKATKIEDAYTAGEYTVMSTRRDGKDQVNVTYLTDKDGGHHIKAIDLYEKGEKRPTEATKKTETTKKK